MCVDNNNNNNIIRKLLLSLNYKFCLSSPSLCVCVHVIIMSFLLLIRKEGGGERNRYNNEAACVINLTQMLLSVCTRIVRQRSLKGGPKNANQYRQKI